VDFLTGPLGPEIVLRWRLQLRGERRGVGAEIEHLRPRPLLGLSHLHGLARHERGDLRGGVVEIAGDDRPLGTHDDAGGLEANLDPVRAVIALRRRRRLRIDVERIVRTGLHARLAADAATAVEVHDAVVAPVERDGRADGHARRRIAVVAPEHGEKAAGVREDAALHVLHPGAKGAERYAVFLFARHRAGVAADAPSLVDHETVT